MSKITNTVRKKALGGIMEFDMIQNGDKIIVAVSGGKDSLTLLDVLYHLQRHSQFDFEIIPVYIIPKIKGIKIFTDELEQIFKKYDLEYKIHDLKVPKSSKLRQGIAEAKTCQWCAYARRITLFKLAEKFNATKIAYGHHMDDLVVTLFMNVQSSKWLKIMPPVNTMKKGDFSLIRPLVRIRESEIIKYCNVNDIVPMKAECVLEKNSMRRKVKRLLEQYEAEIPGFVFNMYQAYMKKIGNDFMDKWNTE